jgi:F-type H+-transporting ATPase subunit epsilon
MHVVLLAVDQKLYEGEVDMVVLPGNAGDLGILDNHEPLLTSLREGTIRLYQKQAVVHEFLVQAGFARVDAKACQVYVF